MESKNDKHALALKVAVFFAGKQKKRNILHINASFNYHYLGYGKHVCGERKVAFCSCLKFFYMW